MRFAKDQVRHTSNRTATVGQPFNVTIASDARWRGLPRRSTHRKGGFSMDRLAVLRVQRGR